MRVHGLIKVVCSTIPLMCISCTMELDEEEDDLGGEIVDESGDGETSPVQYACSDL